MATEIPWPAPSAREDSPQGTASPIDILVLDSWSEGCVAVLGLMRGTTDVFPEPTKSERDLIRARISQFRGILKGAVRPLIVNNFGFVDVQALETPTTEHIAAAVETNRSLVTELLGTSILTSTFHYNLQGMHGYYFLGLLELPFETLAFLMVAVVHGIDEWKTGRYVRVDFDY
ncbi:hypothetical protein C8J57DRAFT_1238539 [Mycena rebaudengoi]|nr:hypothetical protein C8J57DRAFT_1238539 [Mycena rebaudengoi]